MKMLFYWTPLPFDVRNKIKIFKQYVSNEHFLTLRIKQNFLIFFNPPSHEKYVPICDRKQN